MPKGATQKGLERRRRIATYVAAYTGSRGYGPTLVEVAKAIGLSNTATRFHIERMVAEGELRRAAGHRTISLP